MQNILNLISLRRALFIGLGAFLVGRSVLSHDWVGLALGVGVAAYGWFIRG